MISPEGKAEVRYYIYCTLSVYGIVINIVVTLIV